MSPTFSSKRFVVQLLLVFLLFTLGTVIGLGFPAAWLLENQTDRQMEALIDQSNQTTLALGKMSFGILQTFLRRMKVFGMFDKLPQLETVYRQFQVQENEYQQVTFDIVEEERRPMIEVPAYRKKFHGE